MKVTIVYEHSVVHAEGELLRGAEGPPLVLTTYVGDSPWTFQVTFEGSRWLRGHHAPDSEAVAAARVARAMREAGEADTPVMPQPLPIEQPWGFPPPSNQPWAPPADNVLGDGHNVTVTIDGTPLPGTLTISRSTP